MKFKPEHILEILLPLVISGVVVGLGAVLFMFSELFNL